ncbi:MAG: hypothetical protein JJU37_14700 [Balneolaceae bacterium]|nr:hypothetical protein [Balneolaceae bacterium]
MTENEIKQKLIDYLYGEMNSAEKEAFEKQLESNEALRVELDELRGVRRVLQDISVPEPDESNLPDLKSKNHSSKQPERSPKNHFVMRYLLPIAAVFLATILTLSVVNFQAGSNEHGFYMHFGEVQAASEPAINEEDLLNLLNQIRNENALFAATMVEQSHIQQAEQLEEALNALTAYYDERRRQDLLFIAEGLSQLEEDTYYRFLRTDEALGEIIYALSNPN